MLCGNYILSNRSEWTFYFLSSVQFNFTIGELIKSIQRDGLFEGIGKPEPLKGDLSGLWSRRINDVDRLVYVPEEDNNFTIIECKSHYRKNS